MNVREVRLVLVKDDKDPYKGQMVVSHGIDTTTGKKVITSNEPIQFFDGVEYVPGKGWIMNLVSK